MELEATLVAYNLEIEKKNYETARKIAEKHDDAEHSLGMLVRLTGQIAQLDKLVGMEKRIVSGSTSNVTALVRKYVEDGGAD
jgi:hypothetical protein